MSTPKILLVEDEQIAAMDIREMIEESNYEVPNVVRTAEEALDHLENDEVELVIMDIRLPGEKDGVDAVEEINESYDIPIVYLTAHSDEKTLERAKQTNPAGFLVKPVTEADLRTTLEMVIN